MECAGSSTLPRAQSRISDAPDGRASTLGDKVTAATSSTSLYDNVSGANKQPTAGNLQLKTRDRETSTPGGKLNTTNPTPTQVPAGSQTEDVSIFVLHLLKLLIFLYYFFFIHFLKILQIIYFIALTS